MIQQTTLPVSPDTVTVLGSRVKADSPAWVGLDLSRAVLREQSTAGLLLLGASAPLDHHLEVPWCHPADQPGGWSDGMRYRVRPRRKAWRFVKEGNEWRISTK